MPLVQVEVDGERVLVERDRLDVKDVVGEDSNARAIATEWFLDGKLVRRDCHVMLLRGTVMGGEQAAI